MINIHIQQKHRFSSIDIYDSSIPLSPSIYTYTFNASACVYISNLLCSPINTHLHLHIKQLHSLVDMVVVCAWIISHASVNTFHHLCPSLKIPYINIDYLYCYSEYSYAN